MLALAMGFAFVGCEENNEPAEPVYEYFSVLTPESELSLPDYVEGEAVLEVKVKADYPEFEVTVDGEWLTYVPASKAEADAVESVLKFTYTSNDVYGYVLRQLQLHRKRQNSLLSL